MGKLPDFGERLPLFIAAGVIKEPADIDRLVEDDFISGAVLGAFSRHANTGPKQFHWSEQEQKARNRMGLDNPGSRAAGHYLPEGNKKIHAVGQWAIVQVVSLINEDPLEVLPELAQWGVEMGGDGIEIDASCPTQDSNELLCYDFDRTGEVIEAIRQRIGPEPLVSLKVSDLPRSLVNRYAASLEGVDLIAAINSIRGVSGPSIAKDAEHNLALWDMSLKRHKRADMAILSVGGIPGSREGGSQVYERVHHRGAMAVGIAQAAYRASDLRNLSYNMAQGYLDAQEADSLISPNPI